MSAPISSKDKLAYFKDNIQTAEDQDEFDASQYYYNRSRVSGPASGMGGGGIADTMGLVGEGGPMASGLYGQLGGSFAQMHGGPGFGSPGMAGPQPPVPGPPRASTMAPDRSTMMHGMGGPSISGVPDQLYPQPPATRAMSAPAAPYPADALGMGTKPGGVGQASAGAPDAHFDLNEFPALAGPAGLTNELDAGNRYAMQAPEFAMQSEDFPALPGTAPAPQGGGGGSGGIGDGTQSSQSGGLPQDPSAFRAPGAVEGSVLPPAASGMATPGAGGFAVPIPGPSTGPRAMAGLDGVAAGDKTGDGMGPDKQNQYGLLGLLNVIRMTDPDLNTLALGSDLTTLGLNLNSSKSLHATFASPWADGPSKTEPQFQLPLCYYMQSTPPLKHAHLQKFQLETLFYIFYAMPKDLLQAYAAQELYHRDWRYHIDLRLWFRRATAADGITSHSQPQFFYFDINSWETRLFAGNIHGNLTAGLMSEEEVRVRVSQP